MQNGVPDTQSIINHLLPLVLNPVVIFLGFATISVLVPIIEESFKPLGVWFLSGQKITPAQGFGFGVLSGAAFGLFENLGNTSGAGTGWALLTTSRISTLLLHSFTAGLVGWALASAWTQRRFLRLANQLYHRCVHPRIVEWSGRPQRSFFSGRNDFCAAACWAPANRNACDRRYIRLRSAGLCIILRFQLSLAPSVISSGPPTAGVSEPSDVPVEPSELAPTGETFQPASEGNSSAPIPPSDNPPSIETPSEDPSDE